MDLTNFMKKNGRKLSGFMILYIWIAASMILYFYSPWEGLWRLVWIELKILMPFVAIITAGLSIAFTLLALLWLIYISIILVEAVFIIAFPIPISIYLMTKKNILKEIWKITYLVNKIFRIDDEEEVGATLIALVIIGLIDFSVLLPFTNYLFHI